jgi:hypothetical protein
MNWKTYTFIGALAMLIAGAFYLSYSGATLPGPDRTSPLSLQSVQARRTHFMHYYAFGK